MLTLQMRQQTTFFIFIILCTYVNYEWILRDTETGKLITDGPSHYQLPTVADLPKEFNVTLLENSNPGHQSAIYSSKAQCSVTFFSNFLRKSVELKHKNSNFFLLHTEILPEIIE